MPTIVMTSPKGGAGKSTTAVILATEMAHKGYDVTLLDCDLLTADQSALQAWARSGELPPRITLKHMINEQNIIPAIQEGVLQGHIVIVDLGGSASLLATRAISQADLVLVPIRPSPLDAKAARVIVSMIYMEEQTLRRPIAWAAVMTATSQIRSVHHKNILAELEAAGARVLEPELMQRGAYQNFFADGQGGDLRTMKPTATHNKAIENAQAFTDSVLSLLAEVTA